MEILRNINQIYGHLDSLLHLNNEIDFTSANFAFELQSEEFLLPIAEKIVNQPIDEKKVLDLNSLIFQLNNYTDLICNLTHLFLIAKKYDEIYLIISKIFVAHIGNKPYTSKIACSAQERSFDRLVEIVRTANISSTYFVEFLVTIQKNRPMIYSVWKRPAIEYLQNFFLANEDWLMDFVEKNPDYRYHTFGAILHFNTAKGIDLLVKDYTYNPKSDKEQVLALLKDFKREVILYADTLLSKSQPESELEIIEILLGMSSDSEIMTRVQDLYSTTKNPEIKSIISSKLGISGTINIRTEKQFLYAAKRKIKDPQERSLGVPFDKFTLKTLSGLDATDTVFSFIIFLFKEEKNLNNLYKLKILENIFVKEDLQNFAEKLFDTLKHKNDILEAKWCVRMFALLSSNKKLDETFDFLSTLLNQNRNKEAKYLIECLIHSKKVEIIDFIKESIDEGQTLIEENLNHYINEISTCLNLHPEDIKDMLVPSQFSIGEFDIQRDRLFSAFIAGKTYPLQLFRKMFLENKIYNKLAENLVFGEYRYGRLHNAFIIINKTFKYIVGNTIFENDPNKDADIAIGIIHPLDMDFKFQPAVNYFPYPTFDQFKPARFSASDHSVSATTVNRFVGVMINPQKFLKYVFSKGFTPNKHSDEKVFSSIIHIFPLLNIIAEVEFQKTINTDSVYNSLSNICFYKLSDTMQSQNKYLTEKANALAINNLPNRYFNHILSIIFEASKL